MQQFVLQAGRSGSMEPAKEDKKWKAKEVHLVDDKVSDLPQSPNCPSLIALYLQGNFELTAIPPLFFHLMTLLQILDLSHTSIKALPKSLPKLVSLKKLLLRGCELFMELSPQVGKLKNLEELDLDKTQIMHLPKEIGKLLKIRNLRVSFYHICAKKKSKSNFLIHPETISNLSQLAELSIDVNPADKRWDDTVEAVVKEACNSKTLRALSLYLPKIQLLDYAVLRYPSLSCFRFTVGHHKRKIISRVPHEVEAEFRKWDKCLKFVNGENIPIEIIRVLKFSSSFFLDNHATAVYLSEFGIGNMKRLKFCLLAECNKMETLVDGEKLYERNEDDQSVEHVFESLEYLNIYYMENLWSIWRGPNLYGCMSRLKLLALHTCPQLSNIFSLTLLENFVNLEEMILEDCPRVTSLVSRGSFKPMMSDKIFLPSLKRLLLLYLPELVSISNGISIAPKLESIGFYNCPKLKSISKMELSSKYLKIIKGECQWWEDLNWIEIEWGNRPDYLMRIFSPINKEEDVMTQLAKDTDFSEETRQNEGQQLDYTEERKIGTEETKSTPLISVLPPASWLKTSEETHEILTPKIEVSYAKALSRANYNATLAAETKPLELARGMLKKLAEDTNYFEANEGQQLDDKKLLEVSTRDGKGQTYHWSDYTEERKIGTDEMKLTKSMSILPPTPWLKKSEETHEILAQNVEVSSAKGLSMPNCNTTLAAETLPSKLAMGMSGSPTSFCRSTPRIREVYDCDFKKQELKDDSKKRKTLSGWTELIRVTPGKSLEEHLDDGFSWRKYGQRDILGAKYPRGYYRCTHRNAQGGCSAIKQVQQSNDDPTIFEITYCGAHTCILASDVKPSSGRSENQSRGTSSVSPATPDITHLSTSQNPKRQNCLKIRIFENF
ncbi:hypothetical protein DITRI_Ditri03aG0097600 [Diplodiscus trichospermus]